VYNNIYRLDLNTFEWSLVTPLPTSPSQPPEKRCGHSAALWRGHQIIIYGGETERRTYPNDIYSFNTRTHTWHQPHPRGAPPEARSRAAVVLIDDLLYISGGTNENGKVLDDLVVLDLEKMVWRKPERFECRYDHTAFYHDEKIFIYGGLTEQMNRSQDLQSFHLPTGTKTLTRIVGPTTPSVGGDGHFYYPITSATPNPVLLDFVMPVFPSSSTARRKHDASVSALDLHRMHWVVLDTSPAVRDFVWENLVQGNCHGDVCGKAYFIGYRGGTSSIDVDVFSHALEVDLANFGIVVNTPLDTPFSPFGLALEFGALGGIAWDLATLLDDKETADFIIATDPDPPISFSYQSTTPSPPLIEDRPTIAVHTLILRARWPYFNRMLSSNWAENTEKLYILEEPYTVAKSLISHFYTDSLSPTLSTPVVARLLVLSNMYNIPRLRALVLGKLLRDLAVEDATTVWAAAREAGERGLEKRAVRICFEYWGEVVRTRGFREMRREKVVELCGLVGRGARVVDPAGKFEGSEAGDVSESEEIEEDEDEEGEENEDMEY
jgi:hypothetical protein